MAQQITLEERDRIADLTSRGFSQAEIARRLLRSQCFDVLMMEFGLRQLPLNPTSRECSEARLDGARRLQSAAADHAPP